MNNFHKQLRNFDIPTSLNFTSRCPVFISDSKGRYLFEQVSFENNIEWFFRPSIQCSKHLEIIRNKLPKLFDRHPNGVTLFVWLGTCDLTEKDEEGFISLRSRTNSSVYKINSVFKQFYFLTKDCDNVKLVFIELPIYSIYWWNKFKGHSNPEQFKSDDCILHAQIDLLNQYIRDFNRIFHEQQCMVCDL